MSDNLKIIPSSKQTAAWRKSRGLYGRACEDYQRDLVEKIIGKSVPKTHMRLHLFGNYSLKKCACPMTKDDGYEWSEDFDGRQKYANAIFYFNFKFVCGTGGAQTRTLRDETYRFVYTQLMYLKKHPYSKIYYINILDGIGSYNSMKFFNHLLEKKEFEGVVDHVYVGDMLGFQEWFDDNFE